MITKIQKWGNSQGLRLSRQTMESVHLTVGDEVEIEVRDGCIVISPARRVRGKHNLEDLVRQIPEDYDPSGEAWGSPLGKEVW